MNENNSDAHLYYKKFILNLKMHKILLKRLSDTAAYI